MNMQQVTTATLLAAKNRIIALGQTFKDANLAIGQRNDEYDRRKQAAQRELMRPSEFVSLFPLPPTFTAENAEIASKQAQIAAITGTNTFPKGLLEQDIDMLNVMKNMKTATYARELSKPERTMTAAQFSTLYPAPTHATDLSTISAAQTEANKLEAFLKSGHYPNPGAYDVDLLSGTAVSYP
ncbi:hypothetical protein [Methylomonas koyamae]|uniref:Uncharacterized protein n=1 Tax=Methylomonas koyamae TaxID=702114 RepID=A0AA91DBA5_9GAMM|nr:hypothetical protein [Methylomonas koyamae]OAI24551.1 hypothetical protein A1356_15425 [Methylomonas koyamae]